MKVERRPPSLLPAQFELFIALQTSITGDRASEVGLEEEDG